MTILDFRLRHLLQNSPTEERVHVLLQYRNDLSSLSSTGFQVTSVAGDVAAGSIPINRLEQLGQHPQVLRVGGARPLKDETDVSSLAINLIDPIRNSRTIPSSGNGAIIGVIDSGFDLIHPCFLNSQGETRIIAAWDQGNLINAQGKSPAGFNYGIEYTREAINQRLTANELVIKNRESGGKHGTNVAGIAAGNGAPNTAFAGMAPEAELVFVTYVSDSPIGGSAFVLDAIMFIQNQAWERGKPVVINLSQGDNLGAHDGTSLLERAIDYVVDQNLAVIVNSAGNQRGQRHHAEGKVPANRDYALLFKLSPDGSHVDGDEIEIWYDREDRLAVALETPVGWRSQFVQPEMANTITFPTGTRASIDSDIEHPGNGDNRIRIVLEKGEGWEAGSWKVILRGDKVVVGRFHAWTDRPDDLTLITFTRASDNCTTTLPGTSRRVIAVSAFVSRPMEYDEGDVKGALAPFTSIGPTRDGRIKPDLTAPGFAINAPGVHKNGDGNYAPCMGTSMAAPHVTGVVALLLSLRPDLHAKDIKTLLQHAAGVDLFTGVIPSLDWGRGKLNAGAAYEALANPKTKGETIMSTETCELQLSVPDPDGGEPRFLEVRINVENGDITSITAESGENQYVGRLHLKKASPAVVNTSLEADSENTFGGDECIICGPPPLGCRVVSGLLCD